MHYPVYHRPWVRWAVLFALTNQLRPLFVCLILLLVAFPTAFLSSFSVFCPHPLAFFFFCSLPNQRSFSMLDVLISAWPWPFQILFTLLFGLSIGGIFGFCIKHVPHSTSLVTTLCHSPETIRDSFKFRPYEARGSQDSFE